MKLLIATRNQGKLCEYKALLADTGLELIGLADGGITLQVEETGSTFEENAVLKAKAYAKVSGLLTLADDSGLEVDILAGRPGVLSARYDNGCGSDEDRCRLLLRHLRGVSERERGAQFRCVIAIATPTGQVYTTEGICKGRIGFKPQGLFGFGYDPVFFLPQYDCTLAQLPPDQKNGISHRSHAAKSAKVILRGLLG